MEQRLRRDQLLAAGLATVGMVVAMLAVYVGTGLHDGFDDWDLHRLGRRFRRYFPYALLLAAAMGLLLHSYYSAVLRSTPAPWTLLISIPRAFIHFALFGSVALFAFVALFAWRGFDAVGRKLGAAKGAEHPSPGKPFDERIIQTGIALPLWFMLFPITVMTKGDAAWDVEEGSKLAEDINRSLRKPGLKTLKHRMIGLLPWLVACVFVWVGAESEDTGNRVDPYWLTAFASIWFADYLLVAFRVVPVLRARQDEAS